MGGVIPEQHLFARRGTPGYRGEGPPPREKFRHVSGDPLRSATEDHKDPQNLLSHTNSLKFSIGAQISLILTSPQPRKLSSRLQESSSCTFRANLQHVVKHKPLGSIFAPKASQNETKKHAKSELETLKPSQDAPKTPPDASETPRTSILTPPRPL